MSHCHPKQQLKWPISRGHTQALSCGNENSTEVWGEVEKLENQKRLESRKQSRKGVWGQRTGKWRELQSYHEREVPSLSSANLVTWMETKAAKDNCSHEKNRSEVKYRAEGQTELDTRACLDFEGLFSMLLKHGIKVRVFIFWKGDTWEMVKNQGESRIDHTLLRALCDYCTLRAVYNQEGWGLAIENLHFSLWMIWTLSLILLLLWISFNHAGAFLVRPSLPGWVKTLDNSKSSQGAQNSAAW